MNPAVPKRTVRPLGRLLMVLTCLGLLLLALFVHARIGAARQERENRLRRIAVAALGLTDLCVATEARYTRHPAVTDLVVPFMDHPGAIEHFPTGSFWAPPAAPGFNRGER